MRRTYLRRIMTDKIEMTSALKQNFMDKMNPDKIIITLITNVVCGVVGLAVTAAYTKAVIEPRSISEITQITE